MAEPVSCEVCVGKPLQVWAQAEAEGDGGTHYKLSTTKHHLSSITSLGWDLG